MYRAPAFLCQRHYRGALHARKYRDNLIQFLFRGIHQHIFLIFGCLHGIHTEQQLPQYLLLFLAHVLVTNQQGFGLHHNLHFLQAVAHQRRTGTYNIENGICQTDARRHFYRPRNDVYLRIHPILFQKAGKDTRIRCRNLLSVKPLHPRILNILRHGKRQTAFAESQTLDYLCILILLNKFILTHNSYISHSGSHRLRNVVIPQKQHFKRKV